MRLNRWAVLLAAGLLGAILPPVFTKVIDIVWQDWDGVSTNFWEHDYVRELLPAPYFRHTNMSSVSSSAAGGSTCANSGQAGNIKEKLLPSKDSTGEKTFHLVIHISDEFLGTDKNKLGCNKVYDSVPLVLRQYAYHGNAPGHLIQIPLGYMVGYLRDSKEIPPVFTSIQYATWSLSRKSAQRTLKWSFIGGLHGKGKRDRETALDKFNGWSPHVRNESVPVADIRHVYNNSLFVIVGRGWFSLDCFRAYEALIAGAIPVIVGNNREIDHIFNFNGHKAPFLYKDSWDEALKECQRKSNEEIDRMREELVKWYVERIEAIETKISEVFKLPSLLRPTKSRSISDGSKFPSSPTDPKSADLRSTAGVTSPSPRPAALRNKEKPLPPAPPNHHNNVRGAGEEGDSNTTSSASSSSSSPKEDPNTATTTPGSVSAASSISTAAAAAAGKVSWNADRSLPVTYIP